MTSSQLKDLQAQGLITEEQCAQIEPVITKKIVSVFYELRVMLYLGVMLFTTGVGFLIYQNIGQLGHVLAIIALSILSLGAIVYCFWRGKRYTHDKVDSPNPYFDYVLLLGCLLFVSVFGYLQFQFGFLEQNARAVSLITALLFFFLAYRFDHLGILSLAITAFASFFGIVVSWSGLDSLNHLSHVGLGFSVGLAVLAVVLNRIEIKKHFTFSYLNIGALIFFSSALAGVFNGYKIMNDGDYAYTQFDVPINFWTSYWPYALVLYAGVGVCVWIAHWQKSFLFLLYGVVAGYVITTYLIADNNMLGIYTWLLYLLFSASGLVYFIIRFRNYFKRQS